MELFENNRVEGKFIKRVNRFIAEVEISGEVHKVHVPNTGRMKELLTGGARVLLKYHPAPHKKTAYSLISVEKDGILVCIDSRIANQIYFEYLSDHKEDDFPRIEQLKREVGYGNSRFDIGFIQDKKRVLIEIKSVNLVQDSIALFPDAPTTRGTKHVKELTRAKNHGIETGVVFIIQRNDASSFMPYWGMDKDFSKALQEAYQQGVWIKAYRCLVQEKDIKIEQEVSIDFNKMDNAY